MYWIIFRMRTVMNNCSKMRHLSHMYSDWEPRLKNTMYVIASVNEITDILSLILTLYNMYNWKLVGALLSLWLLCYRMRRDWRLCVYKLLPSTGRTTVNISSSKLIPWYKVPKHKIKLTFTGQNKVYSFCNCSHIYTRTLILFFCKLVLS